MRSCFDCARGWKREDGRAGCGAGVNDARLAGDDFGPQNAVWAERKYGLAGMMAALSGQPLSDTDCENLDPGVANACKLYMEQPNAD